MGRASCMDAALDALQLNVTLLLLVVGPGLLVEPGLGLVGVSGMGSTPPGVWKYSTVVKPEQPALLHASTFQRYGLPALRLAVYEVLLVLVSTTSALVDI